MTTDVIVLGIPRGGVEVGAVVAARLGAPLDVVIPRKIGAPGNPELGLGAVAEGVQVLDARLIAALDVTTTTFAARSRARGGDPPAHRRVSRRARAADLSGKVAVVVDDGVATGGTAVAACVGPRRAERSA